MLISRMNASAVTSHCAHSRRNCVYPVIKGLRPRCLIGKGCTVASLMSSAVISAIRITRGAIFRHWLMRCINSIIPSLDSVSSGIRSIIPSSQWSVPPAMLMRWITRFRCMLARIAMEVRMRLSWHGTDRTLGKTASIVMMAEMPWSDSTMIRLLSPCWENIRKPVVQPVILRGGSKAFRRHVSIVTGSRPGTLGFSL